MGDGLPHGWDLKGSPQKKSRSRNWNGFFHSKGRRRPTLPFLHSTIGANRLNFSVRNGKRWNPVAKTTLMRPPLTPPKEGDLEVKCCCFFCPLTDTIVSVNTPPGIRREILPFSPLGWSRWGEYRWHTGKDSKRKLTFINNLSLIIDHCSLLIVIMLECGSGLPQLKSFG